MNRFSECWVDPVWSHNHQAWSQPAFVFPSQLSCRRSSAFFFFFLSQHVELCHCSECRTWMWLIESIMRRAYMLSFFSTTQKNNTRKRHDRDKFHCQGAAPLDGTTANVKTKTHTHTHTHKIKIESLHYWGRTRGSEGEKVKVKERECACPSSGVCILFMSVTYSTLTNIKTVVKCLYDIHRLATGRFQLNFCWEWHICHGEKCVRCRIWRWRGTAAKLDVCVRSTSHASCMNGLPVNMDAGMKSVR